MWQETLSEEEEVIQYNADSVRLRMMNTTSYMSWITIIINCERCFGDKAAVSHSGGASIGGARAPPLLKFWDEKKRRRKKYNIYCQKTLYTKSFKE